MPCSEPQQSTSDWQAENTAKAICILYKKLGSQAPDEIADMVGGYSFHGKDCDRLTGFLCDSIKMMPPDLVEAIIYDAHDADSRILAAWWDDHKEKDAKREKE